MRGSTEKLEIEYATYMELPYLLYLPADLEVGKSGPPLLLFLHGMGERGSDLNLVKTYGPPARIENGLELPFVVAAPQCPADEIWQPYTLAALLEDIIKRYKIDRARIYLTGLSMGGSGTWALANARRDLFAAIAPICGPFTMIDPVRFTDIPVWCFHGAMDDTVPVEDSVRMVKWLRGNGADVRFTVYPDAGHDSWTQAYDGTELYDWFKSHSKRTEP